MSSEAITHSLDEICREFLYIERHKIVSDTADHRRRDFEFIQDRARIVQFLLHLLHEFHSYC